MFYKASFHIHTREDFIDGKIIDYSIYDLIDEAKNHDFKILALTGHEKFICKEEYVRYASNKGILLIPGIELALNKSFFTQDHVLVLNCSKSAEEIRDFKDLKDYRMNNPDCFIIAPHPEFDHFNSISLDSLKFNIDLFDAIEHSWFYSKNWNKNIAVDKIAKKYNKPLISTSDVHFLELIGGDHVIIESESLTMENIFESIRNHRYENITRPKSILLIIKKLSIMYYRTFFRRKKR